MKNILFLSIITLFIISCKNSNTNTQALLPSTIGGADELMIIMNDNFLNDDFKQQIKTSLVDPYKIMPQEQARFAYSIVPFSKLNTLLKRFINPIYVVTRNEQGVLKKMISTLLNDEELAQVKDGSKTIFHKKNLWAKDQNITIIIAENEKSILSTLEKSKALINEFYDESNLLHFSKIAYIDGVNSTLNKQFKEYHGFTYDIPLGYVLAKNEKNFVLLRKDEDKSTLFLAIDVVYYNAKIPINNLGIEKFNDLGIHLDGDKKDSYVVADTTLGFDISKTVNGNITTFENAGLWVMENDFVGGGPFVNNYIIDNNKNRVIYLSGMIYGPAEKNKKKYMRQFEAIFSSLKFL